WGLLPDGAGMVAPVARVSGAVHARPHRCDPLLGGVECRCRSGNPPNSLPPVSPGTPSGEPCGFSADRLDAVVSALRGDAAPGPITTGFTNGREPSRLGIGKRGAARVADEAPTRSGAGRHERS